MSIEELNVAGSVRLKGPIKLGIIRVSGSLSADGDIEAEALHTSGSMGVAGNLKAKEIRISGLLAVRGDAETRDLDVSGFAIITGSLGASEIRISGKLVAPEIKAEIIDVSGKIFSRVITARKIRIRKKSVVEGEIRACEVIVEREAEAEAIIAEKAEVEMKAKVGRIVVGNVTIRRYAYVKELEYMEGEIAPEAEIDSIKKDDRAPGLEHCSTGL